VHALPSFGGALGQFDAAPVPLELAVVEPLLVDPPWPVDWATTLPPHAAPRVSASSEGAKRRSVTMRFIVRPSGAGSNTMALRYSRKHRLLVHTTAAHYDKGIGFLRDRGRPAFR
jgi:hypothetical protein